MKLTDEMLRPLATLVLSAVTVFQLATRPSAALTWALTAVVIASAVASVFVLDRLPERGQIAVAGTFVLSSALCSRWPRPPPGWRSSSSRPARPGVSWSRGTSL
ncbi:hypothetical protein ACFWN2_21955 [Lentzea sp. NPDC058436]|uniref:hypothetical protein n=1 Tax=Lentzea sp. NPDC058436 TaxID=3346499 RepID=UPI0036644B0A